MLTFSAHLTKKYLLKGLLKCTIVLSSLNMFTSSISCNGYTPTKSRITRCQIWSKHTEFLNGRLKFLVFIHVLLVNMLLLSSLGTYAELNQEQMYTFSTNLGVSKASFKLFSRINNFLLHLL